MVLKRHIYLQMEPIKIKIKLVVGWNVAGVLLLLKINFVKYISNQYIGFTTLNVYFILNYVRVILLHSDYIMY